MRGCTGIVCAMILQVVLWSLAGKLSSLKEKFPNNSSEINSWLGGDRVNIGFGSSGFSDRVDTEYCTA